MTRQADVVLPPAARVAIVMMSAIGDAVHVLPLLGALKRHDPRTTISWVLEPGPASLVRGHPHLDEILPFEKRLGWRALRYIQRATAGRTFDLVIDLQVYLKAGLVTSILRSPVKLGFDRARARDLNWLFTTHRIPPHAPQHVQDQYLEFLSALGVRATPLAWNLGPWPAERPWQESFRARFDRPLVALVIGSSRPEKDWRAERWAHLVDSLTSDFALAPVLVGGHSPRERDTARIICEQARHPPALALDTGLRHLTSILDASALIISLDTGPLHMAVALARPVISLMGYNNPKRVGPYRLFHDLIVDAYGDPGEDYPISMAHRAGRMQRIQVRDVVEKVETWAKRYRVPDEVSRS